MWEEDEDAVSPSRSLSLLSLSLSPISPSLCFARSLTHPLSPTLSLPPFLCIEKSPIYRLTRSLFVRQVIDIIMKHNDQKDDTAAVKALCVQRFDLCKSSDIAVSKAHEEL